MHDDSNDGDDSNDEDEDDDNGDDNGDEDDDNGDEDDDDDDDIDDGDGDNDDDDDFTDLGDVHAEFCESEEDARKVATKICLHDSDIVVVYDKIQHRLWVKNMLRSGLPLTNRNRISFFAQRDLHQESSFYNQINDVDEVQPCCNVCTLS